MSCKIYKKMKNKSRVQNGVKKTVIILVEVCLESKRRNNQHSINLKVKMTACSSSNNRDKFKKRLKTNPKTNFKK